jgi:hypothetical protein
MGLNEVVNIEVVDVDAGRARRVGIGSRMCWSSDRRETDMSQPPSRL